jgi:hypothetical protein
MMLHPTQELKPPANPAQFKTPVEADVCGPEHAGGFAQGSPWENVWSATLLQGLCG